MNKLVLPLLFALAMNSFAFQTTKEIRKVDGKDFLVYKIQKGDTWYAIAREFSISYAELRVANKNVDDKLILGNELLIPAKLKVNDPYFQKNQLDNKSETKTKENYHIVQKSQTLYSISKLYGPSVEQLKEWNNLNSNEISIGQKLIVGKPVTVATEPVKQITVGTTEPIVVQETVNVETKSKEVIDESEQPDSNQIDLDNKDSSLAVSSEVIMTSPTIETKVEAPPVSVEVDTTEESESDVVFSNGMQQVQESGIAKWIDKEDANFDKYYALHRTAKPGTVIRVTNISNSIKIYVKVAGKMSDERSNDGILIVLSKASAEKLEITDDTANVNLLYGVVKD